MFRIDRVCIPAVILLVLSIAATAMAGVSKTASTTNGTSTTLTFAPNIYAQTVVKSIYGTSDKAGSVFSIYGRSGKALVTEDATNAQKVIYVDNSAYAFTNADRVIYYHLSGGVCDATTIASATTSNVTLTAGISQAGAAGDVLYELSQQFSLPCGATSTPYTGTAIFYSPVESPVQIVLDATNACRQSATVD